MICYSTPDFRLVWIPDSKGWFPDSKGLDSGFQTQKYVGFRILLHAWGDTKIKYDSSSSIGDGTIKDHFFLSIHVDIEGFIYSLN